MTDVRQLGLPVRKWVPDWLGLVTIFSVILPVILLNGSYTGSMLEVSYTLGTNSEDITMGYYAASAGMAIAYPIIPKYSMPSPARRSFSATLCCSSC